MYKYYDLMAKVLGGILIFSGVGGIIGGTYLTAVALMAAGGVSIAYSQQLKAKSKKRQLLEESPITANRPRLEDKQIIKRITEAKFDPVNFEVKDIEKGSLLDYNLDTWTVEDVRYLYWLEADGQDEHQISKDAIISYGNQKYNIQVYQDKANTEIPVTQEVNAFMIDPKMQTYINLKTFDPPPLLTFKDEKFYREVRKKGYSIERKYMTYNEFQTYNFYNEGKSKIIRLSYYGDKQIKAEVGTLEKDIKFSNVLPAPDDDNLLITD